MTALTPTRPWPVAQRGVTLIELMVAMVLGLLVSAGIVTVFSSTSSSNKAQNQLATLQEEGRFAIGRIDSDLRMANALYCNNSGGTAQSVSSGTLLDAVRTPRVFATNLIDVARPSSSALADVTTGWGTAGYPAAPTSSYPMPAFLYMRGYDCTLTACLPIDPVAAGVPAAGTAEGDRVKGSDVVTVRYVNSDGGWSIGETGGSSLVVATAGGVPVLTTITLSPLAGEPAISKFAPTDLAMLADCSNAQIFALGSASGGVLTVAGGANFAGTAPVVPIPQSAPRVFDVNRDFRTVTYYLKVVSVNNDSKAPYTGALMRRVNGGASHSADRDGSEDELVRGVERMDFRYGIEDANGNTSFLTAGQVDSATDCAPQESGALTTAGCLWRSVKSIEVSILMDGQVPLYTLSSNDLKYAYSADANTGLLAPNDHSIRPSDQGFPDQVLRREFNTLVAVRNFNP